MQDPIRYLLVGSEARESRRILAQLAEAGHVGRRTATLHEAVERLARGGVDVVLLDMVLPDVDAVSRIRNAANDRVAIVVLADVDDASLAEEAVNAGAQAFLYVGHAEPRLLDCTLRHAMVRKQLHDRLREARKMEILGRLATGIAHDFNNQLTAIAGFNELAAWELESDHPAREYLDHIQEASGRAAVLANNLLAFGRREGFRTQIVEFDAMLAPIGKVLARVLGEDMELTFRPGAGRALVEVDPVQIQQVVLHLALRAREAMPEEGALRIETAIAGAESPPHPGLPPGAQVVLTVHDRMGSEDELEPIALVEELTRANGGRLETEIEPGGGVTTRIHLPLREAEESPLARSSFADLRGEETVLVVEDDDAVRELVRCVLEECGYCVLEATDAEGALDICRKYGQRVDLLLADLVLPGRGGVELATLASRDRPQLRVLFVSGYGARASVPDGAHLLPKPLTPDLLAREVRRVLDD